MRLEFKRPLLGGHHWVSSFRVEVLAAEYFDTHTHTVCVSHNLWVQFPSLLPKSLTSHHGIHRYILDICMYIYIYICIFIRHIWIPFPDVASLNIINPWVSSMSWSSSSGSGRQADGWVKDTLQFFFNGCKTEAQKGLVPWCCWGWSLPEISFFLGKGISILLTYIRVYIYSYIYTYMDIYIYIYLFIYLYIFVYVQTTWSIGWWKSFFDLFPFLLAPNFGAASLVVCSYPFWGSTGQLNP